VGCYVEIVHPLPVGTEVQLQITVEGVLLDIAARVASNDPGIGMGMEFTAISKEQEEALMRTVNDVASGEPTATQETKPPRRDSAPVQITREAAPRILAMVVKRINEKGIVTRLDFLEMVKASK